MAYSSKIFESAVNELSKLPTIGKKTAARLIFHLLQKDIAQVRALSESLVDLKEKICYCELCANLSDTKICSICSDATRNKNMMCIVENVRDVMAIENTEHYYGIYHVLGGLIAPLDGIGPEDLTINLLIKRIEEKHFEEIIFALPPTVQGDTTIFYILKKIPDAENKKITLISRGIAFGGDLEYTDEMTLAHALSKRLPVENYI